MQNQQSGNNAEAEIYQSQGDPADQESAQEETYDIHIDQQEAEEIVTIGDAVETLRRATKGKRNGK